MERREDEVHVYFRIEPIAVPLTSSHERSRRTRRWTLSSSRYILKRAYARRQLRLLMMIGEYESATIIDRLSRGLRLNQQWNSTLGKVLPRYQEWRAVLHK